ncbi:Phosphate regulon transcriptional regulatory protein PhoB [Candidatus Entotheonellaceae bacterium PAL068K]
MARAHIVVIDDEPDILILVRYNLEKNGYAVTGAASGEDALSCIHASPPNLVLLDLMLPGMDGLEVCKTLKHYPRTAHIPIVMLSARGDDADIVAGLELGADDYLTKPFSPRVLLARIKAVLRRQRPGPMTDETIIERRNLLIHPGRHEVRVLGQPIALTPTEFRLLHLLGRRPGWVFTRAQIVAGVQGDGVTVTERSVDVHIVALRRKLGVSGTCIETVRGVGYRFHDLEE